MSRIACSSAITVLLAACTSTNGNSTIYGTFVGSDATNGSDVTSSGGDTTLGGTIPANAGTYQSGSSVFTSTIAPIISKACARLMNECHYLCSNVFVTCQPTQADCEKYWTEQYTKNYPTPWTDTALAAVCSADMAAVSCENLNDPGTYACAYALVKGCPGDTDAYGMDYTWQRAVDLKAAPATITVHLCEDIGEWFKLPLKTGDRLRLTGVGTKPGGNTYLTVEMHLPNADLTSPKEPYQVDQNQVGWTTDGHDIQPAPKDATYLLRVRMHGLPDVDAQVQLSIAPPK